MLVREAILLGETIDGRAAAERQKSEAAANRRIAANEQRFRALVQNASDIIAVIDEDGTRWITPRDGLRGGAVSSLLARDGGGLWVGFRSDGLARLPLAPGWSGAGGH